VSAYLSSIRACLYYGDSFNWNFGLSQASVGSWGPAEETLLLVQSAIRGLHEGVLLWHRMAGALLKTHTQKTSKTRTSSLPEPEPPAAQQPPRAVCCAAVLRVTYMLEDMVDMGVQASDPTSDSALLHRCLLLISCYPAWVAVAVALPVACWPFWRF
jgi:hypothetical protein